MENISVDSIGLEYHIHPDVNYKSTLSSNTG